MKIAAAVLLLPTLCAADGRASVTPVTKVLEMLTSMLQEAKNAKHGEQIQYSAYSQFCTDTEAQKVKVIEETGQKIEMLKADIQSSEAEADSLGKESAELLSEVGGWEQDMKNATDQRHTDRVDFEATHQDYTESIAALQGAIAVLKSKAKDVPQASALLQRALKNARGKASAAAKRVLDAFLAHDPDEGLAVTAPEANAYEFQSGDVIDMLEKLLDKFKDELRGLEKSEMESRHGYETLHMDLDNSVKSAEHFAAEKKKAQAEQLQEAAAAKGDLDDAELSKAEDEKYLAGLKAECATKSEDFEARQKLRAEEIEALSKAIEIIEGEVKGRAEAHLPTMIQRSGPSLVQVHRKSGNPNLQRAADYLRSQAKLLDSRVLSTIAMKAEEDPFAKVKKLIEDLIARLESEAAEEAEHKEWCDTELESNKKTRQEKAAAVETLHAEIDELTASIAKLVKELAELAAEIAEIKAAVAKAEALRAKEKEANEVTIDDAQKAQDAVSSAISILKEFYAKAADATALVQRRKEEPETKPEIFDSPYKGQQVESNNVVAMLEVIHSDFARLESETSSQEAAAAAAHQDFLDQSEASTKEKEKSITLKTSEKQGQEQSMVEKKADLETNQKQLDAALAYFDKLKPSCIDLGHTYDDRVARRQEEIQSLQEALAILNGEELP